MKGSIGRRRAFSLLAAIAATTMAAGCSHGETRHDAAADVRRDDPATIRGAIYIPAKAYNAPQMWKDFDPAQTARDLDSARAINLNALRVWASYEYWQRDPDRFGTHFDQFLSIAKARGIRVLVSLFENDGVQPTETNLWASDPATGFAVQSPGRAIAAGPEAGWEQPRRFVQWFMKRYGNDDRVLAIEIMNEPNLAGAEPATVPFAKAMFTTAKSMQGSVPLTVGTNLIAIARQFVPLGLDIIEFHDNFPRDEQEMRGRIDEALAMGKSTGLPVWLTEWQRIRPGGSGWGEQKVADTDSGIDYASLAPIVRDYPVGTFFWSLMVKRAYLPVQRFKGTVNGLFWSDGAVASLRDARAIADDPGLELQERPIPADYGAVAAPRR